MIEGAAPGAASPSQVLEQVPFASGLDSDQRDAVTELGESIEVPSGEVIVREGERSDAFWVLLEGDATVVVEPEDAAHTSLATLGPGAVFGDLSAVLGEPHTASVIATSRCRLLRIPFEELVSETERTPAIAVALYRDAVRRLRAAIGGRDALTLESRPGPIELDEQDVSRTRSYMATYYTTAFRNLVKRHKLLVERRFPSWQVSVQVEAAEIERWRELFDVPDGVPTPPFTVHTVQGTLALMRMVEALGVNFRHLMHLKTEMAWRRPGAGLEPGVAYSAAYELDDLVPIGEDRVAIVCRAWIRDPDGEVVSSSVEYFVVLELSPEIIEQLRAHDAYGRRDGAEFSELSKREPTLQGADLVREGRIEVPEGMGMAYGRISGDLNVVHTTRAAAKAFGFRKPFIQGLCSANYVLRELTVAGYDIESLTLTFSRRVYVGTEIVVRASAERVELTSDDGKLLAFGDWRGTPRE